MKKILELAQIRLKAVAGSRHAWWLTMAGLTGGNEQYWACRRKSVRFRILQGWMVTRIPALIFGGIMDMGVYTSYTYPKVFILLLIHSS